MAEVLGKFKVINGVIIMTPEDYANIASAVKAANFALKTNNKNPGVKCYARALRRYRGPRAGDGRDRSQHQSMCLKRMAKSVTIYLYVERKFS